MTLWGMLATASCQLGLLDAAGLMGPLPEGSFFALLAEHGDRIVRDEDFAECYSDRMGRPSIPPSLLARVLLLQYRCGLSDEQAMESVAWDLRWKSALGLAVDHRGWHPTSLTKFRARLLLHGKERLSLENTLRLAEELGMLDAPAEQIVDSTPMLGAAATQDTVRLVRHGIKRLIDAVAVVDERAGRSMMGWSSSMRSRRRSRIAAGGSRPNASGCSRGWRRTPSGRCRRSSGARGCWTMNWSPRRTDCCGS
jgi:transposase